MSVVGDEERLEGLSRHLDPCTKPSNLALLEHNTKPEALFALWFLAPLTVAVC